MWLDGDELMWRVIGWWWRNVLDYVCAELLFLQMLVVIRDAPDSDLNYPIRAGYQARLCWVSWGAGENRQKIDNKNGKKSFSMHFFQKIYTH